MELLHEIREHVNKYANATNSVECIQRRKKWGYAAVMPVDEYASITKQYAPIAKITIEL
jgi:hypothetical protein